MCALTPVTLAAVTVLLAPGVSFGLDERLETARRRITALFDELANPPR
jgi:hypothetical protein